MEGDVIESIAARIRFATGCSYSTSVEAAAISVNLLKPSHDESKNRIADLEAKLATAEAEVVRLREPWQPIETAPRDGRLLLCASMTNQLHGYYDRAVLRYISELQGWSCPGLSGLSPTHWQPLPEPPKEME